MRLWTHKGLLFGMGLSFGILFPIPPGYRPVWQDEFDGKTPDLREWNYRIGKAKLSTCDRDSVTFTNGALRIALTEKNGAYGGGGLISKRSFSNGYFEVSCRIDGGYGWHESFWTTWADSMERISDPSYKTKPRIEIDAFEHYGSHDGYQVTYGTIQWFPLQGNINRDYIKTEADLSKGFHTWGFEVCEDFIVYWFDGKAQKPVDLRGIPQSPFHLWLTTIATMSNAKAQNGECLFDWVRCYEPDPEDHGARRKSVLAMLEAEGGAMVRSKGQDLWIEAEDFLEKGVWQVERDGNGPVLRGLTKKDPVLTEEKRVARTAIDLMTAGTWKLWVLCRDSSKTGTGTRFFKVAIHDQVSETTFGTHGQEGYAWQEGGTFALGKGMVTLKLVDASQFFARCDKLLLTTDLTFVPQGKGGARNVEHKEGWK